MKNPGVSPTERIFDPETVCVPLTGVMIARAFNPAVPGTVAEVLALANQMGTPYGEGANYALLAPAMKARYGLNSTVVDHLGPQAAYAAVMAAALAGPVVVGLAGDQYNLSPRYQSNHIGHSIAVLYPSGMTGTQLDPLAPAGYQGDPFPPAELAKYATAAIIFKEEVVLATIEKFPARTWALKAGEVAGYSLNAATGALTKAKVHTWPADSGASADERLTLAGKTYLHVTNGYYIGLFVEEGPHAVLSPAPILFTQAQMDEAKKVAASGAAAAAADSVALAAKAAADKF